ncbi:MAG: hypothetical protein JWO94_2116, partial [Verrucomicrobiaceae bacterium]|nr:hypothetical protein [Verrucomicrobiaceae bacterium]
MADYARAFRQVVAQSLGLGHGNGSRSIADQKQWVRREDATLLSKVTSQAIEAWRQECLGTASSGSPVVLRHAKNTLNSHLRKCKALLSPKFLRHLDMGE